MYQSGDVDYIVATDAIGMGLNLDVDHIAFAGDRKFDGWHYRRLHPAEFGQIAGRAGRHLRDGTFGTTGPLPPVRRRPRRDARGPPVRARTDACNGATPILDMGSIERTLTAIARPPAGRGGADPRAARAVDQMALDIVVARSRGRAQGRAQQGRRRCGYGNAARYPDYRKLSPAAHSELVLSVYGFVVRAGRIPDDWFARYVDQPSIAPTARSTR